MSNGPVFEAGPGWGARLGGWFSKNMLYVLPGIAVLVLVIIIVASNGDKDPSLIEVSPSSTASWTPGDATEMIIKGDSYTTVARRIVKISSTAISSMPTKGSYLYAETRLAQEIQNQPLIIGGSIKYNFSVVMHYITTEYANLYPSQRAKWEAMAKSVKF